MSVHTVWDNPQQTVIRADFEGMWTWDEFYRALDQVETMLNTVSHRVDFILNSNSDEMPPSFITHFGRIRPKVHPCAGMVMIVSSAGFARTMFGVIRRLYPAFAGRNMLVPNLETARRVVDERMYS